VTKDGKFVYLSDASTKYDLHNFHDDLWEGRPHGRILKIDTASWSHEVIARNLYFVNGVMLSSDETSLFFAETFSGRLSKLNLKTGAIELVLKTHPTDNISPGPRDGTFWLAHPGQVDAAMQFVTKSAFLRRLLRKLPVPVKAFGMGVLVDEFGKLLDGYSGCDPMSDTTVFYSYRGFTYVGSFTSKGIVRCN